MNRKILASALNQIVSGVLVLLATANPKLTTPSSTSSERPQDASRRTVTLNYGNNQGDLDSRLSRVTSIHDGLLDANVSAYTYMGTSRRVSNTLANGVGHTFVGAGGYSGLDRFGRVIDLNYSKLNGTVYRYQYGYDAMGNRLFARITQRSTNGVLHLNDRSHLYTYDGLQRLETADTGKLNSTNTALQSGTLILGIDWTLDSLGNWSGDTVSPFESVLRTGNFDQDPQLETIAINHDVDMANRLESVTTDGTSVGVQTDLAGNVVHDGTHILRYDAWNRLLDVHEPGTAVLDDDGAVIDGALGDRVAAYSYDGVGRLIRIERTQDEQPVTIDLYYDGVRRIQEVLTTDEGEGGQMAMAGGGGSSGGGGPLEELTPLMGLTPGPEDFGTPAAGSEPGTLELAAATPPVPNVPDGEFDPLADDAAIRLDATSTAVSEPTTPSGGSEPSEGPIPGGGPEPLGGGGAMMGMSAGTITAEREYIWGPDYVDDCVVQLDENNTPYYVIQDANYNVVALLDSTGLPVVQYTYEPYGALQLAESFAQHPVNRLGHQGLFFERYDAGPYDPALVPGGKGLYYARNRFYDPLAGRWNTKDPNATAAPIATALASHGQVVGPSLMMPRILTQYRDGFSLYAYVNSNPLIRTDPSGLFTFGDIMSGVKTGAQIYGIYSTTTSFIGAIRDYTNGISLRNIMLDLALEIAMDKAGGKLLDTVVDFIGPLVRRLGARLAGGWRAHASFDADRAAREALPEENGISIKTRLDIDRHHGFPEQFTDEFDDIGINVQDEIYKFDLDAEHHILNVHGAAQYNKFWDDFFDGKKGPITKANAIHWLKKWANNYFMNP